MIVRNQQRVNPTRRPYVKSSFTFGTTVRHTHRAVSISTHDPAQRYASPYIHDMVDCGKDWMLWGNILPGDACVKGLASLFLLY